MCVWVSLFAICVVTFSARDGRTYDRHSSKFCDDGSVDTVFFPAFLLLVLIHWYGCQSHNTHILATCSLSSYGSLKPIFPSFLSLATKKLLWARRGAEGLWVRGHQQHIELIHRVSLVSKRINQFMIFDPWSKPLRQQQIQERIPPLFFFLMYSSCSFQIVIFFPLLHYHH